MSESRKFYQLYLNTMETPKIILRDPKELKPYEFNNKNHPKEQIDELVKSIKDD